MERMMMVFKQPTKILRYVIALGIIISLGVLWVTPVSAAPTAIPTIKLGIEGSTNPTDMSTSLQILMLLTVLTLAPAILIMMTSFTRVIVVLSFMRNALATQQVPPNQVMIGLALFITFFIMAPTFREINQNALQPYISGKIQQEEAFKRAEVPIRSFMFKQTREKDLALWVRLSDVKKPKTYSDIPTYVLIPSFIISELKTSFQIGFMIFIPFIVIDMIVASSLMSMGMMMLPPMMISLPFKLLLFVLVDGWALVVRSLVLSFQ